MIDYVLKKIMESHDDTMYQTFGNNNRVHNGAIVELGADLGKDNIILPGTYIVGKVKIGSKNAIGPYAIIGTAPQHIGYYDGIIKNDQLMIEIGNENIIREFATVHSPTVRNTKIGNRCLLMTQAHVAHDVQIGNGVVLTNNVDLAGHVSVMDYANIGLGSVVHQYSVIGAYTMLGMHSTIVKDVPPFVKYNEKLGCYDINNVGMTRNGLHTLDIQTVTEFYKKGNKLPDHLYKIMEEFESLRMRKTTTKDPLYKVGIIS